MVLYFICDLNRSPLLYEIKNSCTRIVTYMLCSLSVYLSCEYTTIILSHTSLCSSSVYLSCECTMDNFAKCQFSDNACIEGVGLLFLRGFKEPIWPLLVPYYLIICPCLFLLHSLAPQTTSNMSYFILPFSSSDNHASMCQCEMGYGM